MSLLQTKKPTFHIILAFLITVLLNSNIHVQAENMDKKERAHTLWEQGKKSFHAGLNSYPYHYMSKFGQKTRMLKRRQLLEMRE
ncbi:MAG: hypothetical protein MAG551_00520 [Candidatus Scalindua arabica]|uniref:Uncharacterized protein n=1 Tax=Candidatus Scalindua arabica TaxID=1127984 RepID=A0A942A117_9BACT|nr:hypothetical protein [Candidatus Scalindua arabica]